MRNFKQMTAIGLSVLSIVQAFSPVFAEVNTISNADLLSSALRGYRMMYIIATILIIVAIIIIIKIGQMYKKL